MGLGLQVYSGLLPLKLNTGADKRELDRALFLRRSLARHWKGARRFGLHIVCRDDEAAIVAQAVQDAGGQDRIEDIVYKESDFFALESDFFGIEGMYKQQLIKLMVPPKLGLGAFLTLDADVLCLRDFDEGTFVVDRRLASTWEPRGIHSWWENSMSATGISSDMSRPGLGVTPNLLHADICAKVEAYFRGKGQDALTVLCGRTRHHPDLKRYEHEAGISLVWSEYSLYNLVGEWFDLLDAYHLKASEVGETGIRLHSTRNVWGRDDVGRLKPDEADQGYMLVVQSWAGVAVENIAERLDIDR